MKLEIQRDGYKHMKCEVFFIAETALDAILLEHGVFKSGSKINIYQSVWEDMLVCAGIEDAKATHAPMSWYVYLQHTYLTLNLYAINRRDGFAHSVLDVSRMSDFLQYYATNQGLYTCQCTEEDIMVFFSYLRISSMSDHRREAVVRDIVALQRCEKIDAINKEITPC
jgi:hypothetical protein